MLRSCAATASCLAALVFATPAAAIPPANNAFGNAISIPGVAKPAAVPYTLGDATSQAGEPASGGDGKTAWFKWKPNNTGAVFANVCGAPSTQHVQVFRVRNGYAPAVGNLEPAQSGDTYRCPAATPACTAGARWPTRPTTSSSTTWAPRSRGASSSIRTTSRPTPRAWARGRRSPPRTSRRRSPPARTRTRSASSTTRRPGRRARARSSSRVSPTGSTRSRSERWTRMATSARSARRPGSSMRRRPPSRSRRPTCPPPPRRHAR